MDEEGRTETVKGILIINPLRSKPLIERDPINEKQVQLAIRNNSLIITTHVLLRLFESFLNGEISVDQIIELFKSKTGLLTETDFK